MHFYFEKKKYNTVCSDLSFQVLISVLFKSVKTKFLFSFPTFTFFLNFSLSWWRYMLPECHSSDLLWPFSERNLCWLTIDKLPNIFTHSLLRMFYSQELQGSSAIKSRYCFCRGPIRFLATASGNKWLPVSPNLNNTMPLTSTGTYAHTTHAWICA